jgi:hypothetical protein
LPAFSLLLFNFLLNVRSPGGASMDFISNHRLSTVPRANGTYRRISGHA